ncbi:hypothetical protein I4U23_003779 [Adineta vaga]|nr:hypothetical protein I4U23_003779 [Adineta vaga]
METNDETSREISSYPSRKRRTSRDSHSSLDRFETRAGTMDEDLQSMEHNSRNIFRQLESKNRELEAHIHSIYADLKAMKYENQNLKVQVENLQQQYDRSATQNGHSHRFKQYSQGKQSEKSELEKFVKDFEERCDLVESNNQELTERLDSCQQTFESQLTNLQECMSNFKINDKNIQHNETILYPQPVEDAEHKSPLKGIKTYLSDDMSTSKEQCHEGKDSCALIEETLCAPCEKQIQLSTDEIQYGLFDVCDKHNLILMKEKDKLKLFDHQGQIDERPWGAFGNANFATCIHWCSFLDCFLILYRFGLHKLLLKLNLKTSQTKFDDITPIKSIRAYSLKHDTANRCNNTYDLLRFITTSPNLPGYLYLNRGYRRIELVNTNSWKMNRGWSKQDLNYSDRDEIRLITCSYDGSYLAMNIKWNDCERFVDLRKRDGQLTSIKRIRMEKDTSSLLLRIQVPFDQEKWLIVDENNNQCYKVSADPDDEKIIPMRTDHIQAIENVPIHLRFVCNNKYLLVGSVVGSDTQKQGVFKFYKLPTLSDKLTLKECT